YPLRAPGTAAGFYEERGPGESGEGLDEDLAAGDVADVQPLLRISRACGVRFEVAQMLALSGGPSMSLPRYAGRQEDRPMKDRTGRVLAIGAFLYVGVVLTVDCLATQGAVF